MNEEILERIFELQKQVDDVKHCIFENDDELRYLRQSISSHENFLAKLEEDIQSAKISIMRVIFKNSKSKDEVCNLVYSTFDIFHTFPIELLKYISDDLWSEETLHFLCVHTFNKSDMIEIMKNIPEDFELKNEVLVLFKSYIDDGYTDSGVREKIIKSIKNNILKCYLLLNNE